MSQSVKLGGLIVQVGFGDFTPTYDDMERFSAAFELADREGGIIILSGEFTITASVDSKGYARWKGRRIKIEILPDEPLLDEPPELN